MLNARRFTRLFLSSIAAVSLLPAQVLNGRIEVTVADPSGQVIAGAKVSVRDLRKQAPFGTPAQTDQTGTAIFLAVPPSEYEVSAEAAGFRKAIVSGFELNASQTIRQNIVMEIGSVTEAVQVEANAVAVNTADATIAKTINMKAIDTLPQLGRNPLALVVLTPGMTFDTNQNDNSFARVNGTRQGATNSRLDGIDVNDAVVPRLGLSLTAANTDSLEEVRIITNGGKAEYGRNAGGQIEMVSRSGSNQWHGNAFDYLRNTLFNANNFFNNTTGTARPVFIQNIFGGTFGGRIIRNKLFFTGNYQGRRLAQGTVRNRTVLTPEAKQGIYRWSSGGTINSFNIPASDPTGKGIDPKMKELMALMPNPNNNDVGDIYNTAGFRFNVSTPARDDQGTGKVDYLLKPTHHIFFRYSRQFNNSIDSLNNAEQRYPGLPDGAQGGTRIGWAVGSDWSLSSSLINEFRLGRQSATTDFIRPYRDGGIAVISNLYTDPINSNLPQGRNSPVLDITDNVSKILGKHTFKTGVNFRRVLQYGYNAAGIYPNVDLGRSLSGNTVPAALGPQGLTSAQRQNFEGLFNDVLGRVGSIAQTFYSDLSTFQPAGAPRVRNTLFRDLGIFFQDDWKIRPNLTLNVGIRWEYFGPPRELNNLQGTLDRIADINTAANINNFVVARTDAWYNADYNNFAPRFGFAWDPFSKGKTSIRGNYGIFYDRVIGAASNTVDGATPGFSLGVTNFPSTAAAPVTVSGITSANLPAKPDKPVLNVPVTRNTTVAVFDPNLRTGYVQQFNFGVQHQITNSTVIDVAYVRTLGVKLFTWLDLNQPKIFGDYLTAFKELQAFNSSGTPVSPNNTIARIFGGASQAISTLGAANFRDGLAGSVADAIDRTAANYNRYNAAGVSPFYIRNFPQFNMVQYGNNNSRSSYNSLQASLAHRSRNMTAQIHYTYSRSIDNTSLDGNGFTAPVDNYNLVLNRGRADFDRPHVMSFLISRTLPFGRGQRFASDVNGFVNRIIGGWEVGVLGIAQSGTPFSVTSGRRTVGSTLNNYANYTGDRTIGSVMKRGNGVYYFTEDEIKRFTFPGAGEYGNSGRNAFRGPAFMNFDLSVVKRIPVWERLQMTYRFEAYNMLNHPNFLPPGNSIVTTSSFGKISGTANAGTGASGARVAQMALRVDF